MQTQPLTEEQYRNMSNIIKPKRSSVAGFIPTTSHLEDGEFMINTADGVMYMRQGSTIKSFALSIGAFGYDFDGADFYQNGTTTVGSEIIPKISLIRGHLSASLSADVSLTTSNTWYDGPGVTLTPGTWLANAVLTQWRTATTAETIFARISTGSVHYASTQAYHASVANSGCTLYLTSLITVASNTAIKLQATSSAGAATSLMKAALTSNGVGNNATMITAVRV